MMVTESRADMCYCPGCSHGLFLEQLGQAMDRVGLAPDKVCLVSDIGCIGTADRYFRCHTFHGLHGRSFTYAEGIKRARPDLTVIVLVGDGGCGIGTAHLVHSARRGAGIKVFVCNNFNFGMTGGQHSPTTPLQGHTTTTPTGMTETAFDICRTVMVNGAAFVARCSAYGDECPSIIELALRSPGYALVDIWELCSAYYVPANKLTPPRLVNLSTTLGMPFGVLQELNLKTQSLPVMPKLQAAPAAQDGPTPKLTWPTRRGLCMAGSAGQRIRSAVGVLGEIAVASGLFAAQQDDFPITVRRGHSLSNLVVDERPIRYFGVDSPDLTIVLSDDGMLRLGSLDALPADAVILADESITVPGRRANVFDFSVESLTRSAGKNSAAMAAMAYGVVRCGWLAPDELLNAAYGAVGGEYRDSTLKAMEAGCRAAAGAVVATSAH